LYDVHGNVWEWCEDDWHDSYEGAPEEGRAWLRENDNDYQKKVLRGGSWNDYSDFCRSAVRVNLVRDVRSNNNGFRVVCEVGRTR
jgi:formylglycine-generating enzyme required for sulfatase activity